MCQCHLQAVPFQRPGNRPGPDRAFPCMNDWQEDSTEPPTTAHLTETAQGTVLRRGTHALCPELCQVSLGRAELHIPLLTPSCPRIKLSNKQAWIQRVWGPRHPQLWVLGWRKARWPHSAGSPVSLPAVAHGDTDSGTPTPVRPGLRGRAQTGLGAPKPLCHGPNHPLDIAGRCDPRGQRGQRRWEDEPRWTGQPVPAVPSPEGAGSRSLGAATRPGAPVPVRWRCQSLPGVPGPPAAPPPRARRARTYRAPRSQRRAGMGWDGRGRGGLGGTGGGAGPAPEAVPGWRCRSRCPAHPRAPPGLTPPRQGWKIN